MDSHHDVSTDNQIEGNILNIVDSASSSQAVQVAIPAEILGRMVELMLPDPLPGHMVRSQDDSLSSIQCPNERARILLNLSHVSQYWRNVIISHASLWSSIEVARMTREHQIVLLCIERSKDVPLRMTDFHYPEYPPLWSRESHRLIYLSLDLFVERTFARSRTSPMHFPRLECLLMSSIEAGGLPDLKFELPRLQRLWLNGPVPWPKYRFSCLTHLALSGHRFKRTISVTEFLDILRENAGLQLLVLVEVAFSGHAKRPQLVELPHLRYIMINDRLDNTVIKNIIPTLILPSTRTARFQFDWFPDGRIVPFATHAKRYLSDDFAISLTISAKTASDCADCFAAIVRGALPELQTLCIHLRDVPTDLINLSPLLHLVRERHVDGRPLKKVFISDEVLKELNSYTKTLKEIASYVDTLECDSSPSPFENSNTGPVRTYIRLPHTHTTFLAAYCPTLYPNPPPPLPSEFITPVEDNNPAPQDAAMIVLKFKVIATDPASVDSESAASKRSYFASKLAGVFADGSICTVR
ncbi:hypothetical protein EW146_g7717 [Bondarzewia mesenterica]|uniref:F-box domain-containing protein n=1 Tax=Bondarzewia mesenterica TaxID=1095465 RepID=A0A4S4LKL2_9AGAM|nr:hypothetical protein EW146_g7717 [Bondarzewia mesenterica]